MDWKEWLSGCAIVFVGFLVLLLILGTYGPQPDPVPSTADEIASACAREFSRPDDIDRCRWELLVERVQQQKQDSMDRARDAVR